MTGREFVTQFAGFRRTVTLVVRVRFAGMDLRGIWAFFLTVTKKGLDSRMTG